MGRRNDEDRHFEILLEQYRECWEDIRDYSRQIWQIPAVLTATVTLIGVLYGTSVSDSHIGRLLTLFLALGFTLVSFVALKKHRFFSNHRVTDLREIQIKLEILLKDPTIKGTLQKIKWETREFSDAHCINATSAYKWHYGLVMAILIGILILLGLEIHSFLHSHLPIPI